MGRKEANRRGASIPRGKIRDPSEAIGLETGGVQTGKRGDIYWIKAEASEGRLSG